jgi:hypothetical protein
MAVVAHRAGGPTWMPSIRAVVPHAANMALGVRRFLRALKKCGQDAKALIQIVFPGSLLVSGVPASSQRSTIAALSRREFGFPPRVVRSAGQLLNHLMLPAWLLLMLSAIAIGVCSAWAQDAAIARDLHDGRLITVRIAGNELRIPRRYFLTRVSQAEQQETILIRAVVPGMDPMREDNKDEFLRARGYGRTVSILIHDARHTTTIEFRLNTTKDLGVPYELEGDTFGLEAYQPKDPQHTNKNRSRPEIYVDKKAGELRGYIECDREGRVPSPICSHVFVYRNMLLTIDYSKRFLPIWSSVEWSVEELIHRFSQEALLNTRSLLTTHLYLPSSAPGSRCRPAGCSRPMAR